MKRFLLPLALFACSLSSAHAASGETKNYQRAFALMDAGRTDQAITYAAQGHDEVLNKILRAGYMAQAGNSYSFDVLTNFITKEPHWPNVRGIQIIAEQKMPPTLTPEQITIWFAAHPPVSLNGFYRYVDALNALGQTSTAEELTRAWWIKHDFLPTDLTAFVTRFGSLLTHDVVWARMDRLLLAKDSEHARNLYPILPDDMKAVAETRIALTNANHDADIQASRLPDAWQNDAGLLFERLRWRRKFNLDDGAAEVLRRMPANPANATAWWDEREIIVRRMMLRHDYKTAYDLAADHGETDPKTVTQAEFLAGWIALRFLNDADRAREHFQILYDKAATPLSRARGAYWLGRAAEANHDANAADQWFSTAAAFNMTYYGMMAAARLDAKPVAQASPEPTIPPQLRAGFYNRDLVRATEKLSRINEKALARIFFRAAMQEANQRIDFAMLTELAYRIDRPDLAIETAKTANQKNMMIAAGGYPLLSLHVPQPPEIALTHALIRQESMFNPEALSTSGAQGLMQLMTATAKGVASKLGVRFKPKKLGDSDFNVKLGTYYIQHQIGVFDGSYILAIAAYNAGPGRVHEWMGQIGDPRRADVDPIDWIESIPVYETRNYVQRVIENLQIYRARLNGGQAALQIARDLKR